MISHAWNTRLLETSHCTKTVLIALTVFAAATSLLAKSEARVWEEPLVIPTYQVAPPDVNPRFYSGRTYQGAKATFYPYPVSDRLTGVREDKTYKAVYLENQYIKICVLPELGGRIFSAVDKGNNYDFFYHQHVIKPALIGMLGAWISGGVEWNVPHHHRASSFMPVDYTIQNNADGSKTVWVGEIELRHRMKWLVGLTLYPDRSYLEMSMKVFNRTPFANPILFWINPAVHANENYQVLFPPDTEWAVQHAKPEFASWPIARQFYGGTDYTRGVDISWWKNNTSPVSFFCFHSDEDFFGGYDHGKQAGVLHIADHNIVPGKKFFEWGNGSQGQMWSKVLSDNDGPYLELMAGAWSDNQPDYSWLQPGQTREWKHWWYPVRELGGVKKATRDAAVNLELTNQVAKIAINTTRKFSDSVVRLQLGEKVLLKKTVTLDPTKPFAALVKLESGVIAEDLRVSLSTADGKELVSYQPVKRKGTPMPKPVEKPKSPKDYATADELYLTGQRIEQLYSPSFEAAPYYEEMLRRDPGDYRANSALGIGLCKQWRWDEAAAHLSNAITRTTANYIRPKDGEAFYYLGVALRGQAVLLGRRFSDSRAAWLEKLDAAADAFHKASWSAAWQGPGYFQLAEVACHHRDFQAALEAIDHALSVNDRNTKAMNLKSAILRNLGQFGAASKLSVEVRAIDPLDIRSPIEQFLAKTKYRSDGMESLSHGSVKIPKSLSQSSIPNALELVIEYANAGLESEAAKVALSTLSALGTEAKNAPDSPLLHFYAGYFGRGLEGTALDAEYLQAERSSPDYCFPFQYEAIEVLKDATNGPSHSADALLYLGNLLYDNQPPQAIKAWERMLTMVSEGQRRDTRPETNVSKLLPLVHRNLGLAYAQQEKDIPKAIASLEKAVELNPTDPRFFYELDVQYEAGGAPVAKRVEMLASHHQVVAQRDDAVTREIGLLTVAGQADRALELLRNRRFHNWEGNSELHNVYANACLRRGQQNFAGKKYREALQDYQAAQEYPENLEVGKSRRESKTIQINYLMGMAYEGLGDSDKAKSFFEKAAGRKENTPSESQYYQALAFQKLSRQDEASRVFEGLVKKGQADLEARPAVDYFAKFGEKQSDRARKAQAHYLAGLGYLGQGKQVEASAELRNALIEDPAHLGSMIHSLEADQKLR